TGTPARLSAASVSCHDTSTSSEWVSAALRRRPQRMCTRRGTSSSHRPASTSSTSTAIPAVTYQAGPDDELEEALPKSGSSTPPTLSLSVGSGVDETVLPPSPAATVVAGVVTAGGWSTCCGWTPV